MSIGQDHADIERMIRELDPQQRKEQPETKEPERWKSPITDPERRIKAGQRVRHRISKRTGTAQGVYPNPKSKNGGYIAQVRWDDGSKWSGRIRNYACPLYMLDAITE
jgi:hypothetical protein